MGKYSQKLIDHAKQSVENALKTTFQGVVQKTAEATGDLIGNKIADRIKKSSQNVTNEHDKEIDKERYISSEEKQKINDDISWYNNIILEYQKNFKDNFLKIKKILKITFLGNTPNQPIKFRTKNWDKINDEHVEHITPIVKLNSKL